MIAKRTILCFEGEELELQPIPDDGWAVIEGSLGNHVVPLGDLKEHEVDGACWCHPSDDDGVLIHHLDGREKIETGERRPA